MDRNFVGGGWENKYGISISIKKDKIAELEANEYGDVKLYVGKRKNQDSKSKQTHYVAVEDSTPSAKPIPPEDPKNPDLPF